MEKCLFLKNYKFVITCEHASNAIPIRFAELFVNANDLLKTHSGYDIGAAEITKRIAEIADSFHLGDYSRLVVDLNRAENHRSAFSEFTKSLSRKEKHDLLQECYYPYRHLIMEKMEAYINHKLSVLHLSIHSFVPILHGKERDCDIGLLYDPKRKYEVEFCQILKTNLKKINPNLNIRFNYPYKGISHGFTTLLRKRHQYDRYVGIEVEINQKFFTNTNSRNKIEEELYLAIKQTLNR